MKDLRIAAITCQSPVGEIDHNLSKTIEWSQKAKKAGAKVVCFPELNITGYCNCPKLDKIAQPIPGRITDILAQLAIDENMVLLVGLAQKNPSGRPFATHCAIFPDGRLEAYQKTHLAAPEKETFEPGNKIPVFTNDGLTFGIQLCFDAHFPELSTAMATKGAEVLFIPHASPRGNPAEKHISWLRHLTARAFDNSVFVVACNQVGENFNGLFFPGNALVIGPTGKLLAKDTHSNSSMLVVDLFSTDLEKVRNHPMRYFFPHRRPELYS